MKKLRARTFFILNSKFEIRNSIPGAVSPPANSGPSPTLGMTSNAARAYFFRGQSVQRRRGDADHAEHQIDLRAMMHFVLDHRAQPLPHRDRRARGRDAFRFEIGFRE